MSATLQPKLDTAVARDFPLEIQKVRVLLAEDNEEQAQITQFLIETGEGSFSVTWKRTLLEAMECLNSTDLDVVLLDLGMPELSSFPSFTAIRATAPNIPVVVLTADDDPHTRQRLLNMGARYYLVKQETDRDELCACLTAAAH